MSARVAAWANWARCTCGSSSHWTDSTCTCAPTRPQQSSLVAAESKGAIFNFRFCLSLIPFICCLTQSWTYVNVFNNTWLLCLYFKSLQSDMYKLFQEALSVFSPSVFTDSKLNFDFSAAPLHSDPSVFALIFHNPCSNPVEWWVQSMCYTFILFQITYCNILMRPIYWSQSSLHF